MMRDEFEAAKPIPPPRPPPTYDPEPPPEAPAININVTVPGGGMPPPGGMMPPPGGMMPPMGMAPGLPPMGMAPPPVMGTPVDTTGDGRPDALGYDTNGDGRVHRIPTRAPPNAPRLKQPRRTRHC